MVEIGMLAIDPGRKAVSRSAASGLTAGVVFDKALSRPRLHRLLADQSACVVAMEACATSHHWGRVAQAHGHEGRLVPAAYVKPFVKRQKNDRADAEAIAEAASRPTMRFVAVKSAETQGRAVAFRTHRCLVRRGPNSSTRSGGIWPSSGWWRRRGRRARRCSRTPSALPEVDLPGPVQEMGALYFEQIARLTEVIERLAGELEAASRTDAELRRLCTIPGIGPVTAGAVAAFAPDLDTFDSGRNFAAWSGLAPRRGRPAARPGSGR